jgi:hypothetical protein
MDQKYIGFSERSGKKAKQIREGDIVIPYVIRAKKMPGAYVVTGPIEKIGVQVWGTPLFPNCLRVDTKIEYQLDNAPRFLDLANTQSWFRRLPNKNFWSFAFRNPPRSLKAEDGEALLAALLEWSITSKE